MGLDGVLIVCQWVIVGFNGVLIVCVYGFWWVLVGFSGIQWCFDCVLNGF